MSVVLVKRVVMYHCQLLGVLFKTQHSKIIWEEPGVPKLSRNLDVEPP